MASVRKRGATYSFRVSYKDADGKYKQIERGGFETKREAELAGNKMEIEIKENRNVLQGERPLHKYFEEYYYLKKHDDISASTRLIYERSIRQVKEFFGDTKINEVTNHTYQKFLTDFGKGRAKATVEKLHFQVRSCFRYAHANGVIPIDPSHDVKIYYTEEAKSRKLMYLSEKELHKLSAYLKKEAETKKGVPHFLLLSIASGARFSEILALTLDDYNFDKAEISITKSYDHQYYHEFKPTKNQSSIRTVTIDQTTNQIMKDYVTEFIQNKKGNSEGFLFYNFEFDRPYSHTAIQKKLTKSCKACNIKQITIHALRHTHASVLLLHGIDVQYIAHRLGHSSTETTRQFYLHLLDEMKERSEDKLAEIFANY